MESYFHWGMILKYNELSSLYSKDAGKQGQQLGKYLCCYVIARALKIRFRNYSRTFPGQVCIRG